MTRSGTDGFCFAFDLANEQIRVDDNNNAGARREHLEISRGSARRPMAPCLLSQRQATLMELKT
jgi:hypothetical protein